MFLNFYRPEDPASLEEALAMNKQLSQGSIECKNCKKSKINYVCLRNIFGRKVKNKRRTIDCNNKKINNYTNEAPSLVGW